MNTNKYLTVVISCTIGYYAKKNFVVLLFCFFFFKYNIMKEEIYECSLKNVALYTRIFKQ